MLKPQWGVYVIAQYSSKDELSAICYDMLIKSIQNVQNPAINFFVLKYTKDDNSTMFYAYNYDEVRKARPEIARKPKTKKNFYMSPSIITEFFRAFRDGRSASNLFLLTHGHGAGFGLFADGSILSIIRMLFGNGNKLEERTTDTDKKIHASILVHNKLFSFGVLPTIPAKKQAEFFLDYLSANNFVTRESKAAILPGLIEHFRVVPLTTIASAIKSGFPGRKIDFMYTMNCFMQMFDSGYLLKDLVDCYMSSENFQFFTGPDYDSLFASLPAADSVSVTDLAGLAKSVIGNYDKKCSSSETLALLIKFSSVQQVETVDLDLSHVCLTANSLAAYGQLKIKLDTIACYFINNKKRLYPIISDAREQCVEVTLSFDGIIDIYHFFDLLKAQVGLDRALKAMLEDILLYLRPGGPLVICLRPTTLCEPILKSMDRPLPTLCPNGLSFFFPKPQGKGDPLPDVRYFMDNFYLKINRLSQKRKPVITWENFVVDFYKSLN